MNIYILFDRHNNVCQVKEKRLPYSVRLHCHGIIENGKVIKGDPVLLNNLPDVIPEGFPGRSRKIEGKPYEKIMCEKFFPHLLNVPWKDYPLTKTFYMTKNGFMSAPNSSIKGCIVEVNGHRKETPL